LSDSIECVFSAFGRGRFRSAHSPFLDRDALVEGPGQVAARVVAPDGEHTCGGADHGTVDWSRAGHGRPHADPEGRMTGAGRGIRHIGRE
jgi:hypothetical protein